MGIFPLHAVKVYNGKGKCNKFMPRDLLYKCPMCRNDTFENKYCRRVAGKVVLCSIIHLIISNWVKMMGLKYLGCFGHYLYQSVHSVYLSVTTIIYLSDITQTITEYMWGR